jgi:hypothetical protein
MKTFDLLPWNPESDAPIGKRAVMVCGQSGGFAFLGTTTYGHSHEVSGGLMTPDQLDRLIVELVAISERLPTDDGTAAAGR